MERTDSVNKFDRSFLFRWILVCVLGLPFLVEIHNVVENIIWREFGIFYDHNIGFLGHFYTVVFLSFSGFILGGWLGLMQWFVLRKEFPQASKWILATSIGVAVGSLLFWLQYILFFAVTPIDKRQSAIFFSEWYPFVACGVCLGLSLGVSQWLVLKQWVYGARWWIAALPLCFSLGFYFANLYRLDGEFLRSIYMLREQLAIQFPGISDLQMIYFFAAISALTALIGVGLVSGVLLDKLPRSQSKQKAAQ